MITIKPPGKIVISTAQSLFLAGSIEMGRAENWQNTLEQRLENFDITILNPRRDNWNASWEQTINCPQFREQVEWELEGLEKASLIPMYFDPNTRSPITLMELGLFAKDKKIVICCPFGFWRRGNIEVVCNKYDIPLFSNIELWIQEIKNRLN